jgi:hypothetical protein
MAFPHIIQGLKIRKSEKKEKIYIFIYILLRFNTSNYTMRRKKRFLLLIIGTNLYSRHDAKDLVLRE